MTNDQAISILKNHKAKTTNIELISLIDETIHWLNDVDNNGNTIEQSLDYATEACKNSLNEAREEIASLLTL